MNIIIGCLLIICLLSIMIIFLLIQFCKDQKKFIDFQAKKLKEEGCVLRKI